MSIKPPYAAQILTGEKTVEFRRSRLRTGVTHVVIYATAPVGKIVGVFEVAGVEAASPSDLWRKHSLNGCIDYEGFKRYFKCARQAVAIRVGRVYALPNPVPLAEFTSIRRPPQSFCYIPEEEISVILERTITICANG